MRALGAARHVGGAQASARAPRRCRQWPPARRASAWRRPSAGTAESPRTARTPDRSPGGTRYVAWRRRRHAAEADTHLRSRRRGCCARGDAGAGTAGQARPDRPPGAPTVLPRQVGAAGGAARGTGRSSKSSAPATRPRRRGCPRSRTVATAFSADSHAGRRARACRADRRPRSRAARAARRPGAFHSCASNRRPTALVVTAKVVASTRWPLTCCGSAVSSKTTARRPARPRAPRPGSSRSSAAVAASLVDRSRSSTWRRVRGYPSRASSRCAASASSIDTKGPTSTSRSDPSSRQANDGRPALVSRPGHHPRVGVARRTR